MELVVIGAFECSQKCPFPTHVPPILAERSEFGFRRIFYDQSITPLNCDHDDNWQKLPNDILNNISVIRVEPIIYRPGDQVIYLGSGVLAVDSSKVKLCLLLVRHIFSRRCFLTLRTVLNIFK